MNIKRIRTFQRLVWDFYKKNKRDFAWRRIKNPYRILVSEVMLQQTQADRVVAFYEKWIDKFPDFESLAKATFGQVYPYWQGLGYNRRAMALQRTAQKVMDEFAGKLPKPARNASPARQADASHAGWRGEIEKLEEFPGIGPYTARAVSIFSFNTPVACIETNIRRVFIYHFFADKNNIEDKEILEIAQRALPAGKAREWHWALMDYGAYLKSHPPVGGSNPNRRHKDYAVQSKFEGSLRQIRGAVLRMLSAKPMAEKELAERIKKLTDQSPERTKKVISALKKEGLIKQGKKKYSLN